MSASPSFPLLDAQSKIDALLADREAFRTCVTLGLPTGRLQMPVMLESGVFLNMELLAADGAALRAAAQAYAVDAARANEYLTFAEAAQLDGNPPEVAKNLDAAFDAVERCSESLRQMLAQMPAAAR